MHFNATTPHRGVAKGATKSLQNKLNNWMSQNFMRVPLAFKSRGKHDKGAS